MHAAIAAPGKASTILTHLFGRGLADERYVVERFQAMADGDIRRWPGDAAAAKGRRARACLVRRWSSVTLVHITLETHLHRRARPQPARQDALASAVARSPDGEPRRIRVAPIRDCSARSLHAFVAGTSAPGGRVITDGW